MKHIINGLIGGILGLILAYLGVGPFRWEWWAVFGCVFLFELNSNLWQSFKK